MQHIKLYITLILVFLIADETFSQQLKLGKNPTVIQKSAVLELQSTNQGLLFPRISDTLGINALGVPDGMVVFFTPTLQLLLRTGGFWRPFNVSTALTSYWSLTGNGGTTASNFLGTTDLRHLYFRTNNVQGMILDSAGNLGVGTSPLFTSGNREKLLVDAGATSSYNVISGKGTIDNYLQLNIQNRSGGATASSDLVATADNGNESVNYVDLGINSSGFTNPSYPVLSGINNAYLYTTGNDFIIGNGTASKNLRFFTGGYANTNERLRIDGNGNVGIGITSPTAYLHLKDGAAAANSAPLKFTSGILQTTAENGAVEYDGTHLYVTLGSVRYTLDQQLSSLTASNGIVRTLNNLTNTLITGIIGNQTVVAGIASGNSLTLSSTTHATKGKILFGTSGYNEAINKLGLGNNIPTEVLDVTGNMKFSGALMPNNNAGVAGYYLASAGAGAPPTWNVFDTASIAGFSTKVRSLFSAAAPLVYSSGAFSIPKANTTTNGYLSSADWNTFNSKGAAYTTGNLAETGSSVLTITGGGNAVLGNGTTILVKQAGASQSGFLTSANWNYFNNKQDPLNFGDITGGDFNISGGSGAVIGTGVSIALPTLNPNVGSFGDPTYSANFTVNGKGLITAAGSSPIAFPVTSVNTLTGPVSLGISNLNDAIITTPEISQVLQYNGTNWVNTNPTYISNAITSLNGITTSTQTFGVPATNGTAPYWNSTDSTHTLNIPLASATGVTAGLVSNADWSSFSNKLSAIDTSNIPAFSQKVRSLFSATAPITYSNGTIGITQAKTAANGYLSSTDWNIFNNKVGSISLSGNAVEAATTYTVTAGAATGTRALNTQVKNTVFSGPASGVDAVPTFRALVPADLPVATTSTVGGISVGTGLSVTAGGVLSATNTSSGTVTTVSASGTQGVTTSVATPTTTPAITIGLGAITPTSVAAVGSVSGSNLSGTNTGDQTITLTSDVTGTGTGSFATTIGANKVSYAKMQQVTASKLLGNPTGSLANAAEISLGTGLSFVGSTLTYTPATSGTVTSVGLSLPSIFSVANSPVTSSGTLTGTLNTQNANLIFAGPSTGVAATPGFRSLAAADLPVATTTTVGGVSVGTGLSVTAGGVLTTTSAAPSGAAGGDLTGTYPNPTLVTVNTNVGTFGSTTVVPQITVNGKGLITAVSPQTIAFPVTSVNTATGAVSLGIANMNDATITTPAANQVLQYNGTKWVNTTPSYISSAITSLNGLTASTQTFATPGTTGTAPSWSSTGSVHTLNIPLSSAASVTAGLLSNTDYSTFNNKVGSISLGGTVVDAATTFSVTTGAATGTRTLNTQVKNTIFSGPASGADATPTFRALAPADLPIATATLLGSVSIGSGLAVTAGGVLSATNTNAGTVTSVSASSSQGVTVSVSNPTTTPSVAIGLGAITPTSVAATGAVSGSNLSGTNTGDQTITLTSDVTGTGTGSFATTIGANKVSYAKMQQVTAARLLGNPTASLANAAEISLGTGLSFVGSTLTYTPATSGTVTSVGLSLPSIFTVTNSPVTAAGILTGTFNTQSANQFFAGPSTGAATAPTFRSIAAADLPIATASALGAISAGSGLSVSGTGVLSTNFNLASLSATAPLTYNNTTGVFAMPNASTTVDGYLSATDWNTFNNKANVASTWSINGNTGTSAATNFIGTTDAQDLVFKANNTERLRIVNGVSAATGTTGDVTLGDANSGTVRSNKEMVMREDGDVFGPSALRLRNRSGENGAIFETIGSSAALVDFLFKTGTTASPISSNIRFETRATNMKVTGNTTEWQFGQPDVVNGGPTLVVGAFGTGSASSLRIGNFGIGNTAPTEKLDITGNLKFSGALMPNNTAGTSGYMLTSAGTNTAPSWVNPASVSWSLLGNTGTNTSTNFLGTTDLKSLTFRTNNTQALMIDSLGNVGLGASPTFTASPNREKFLVDVGTNAANDFVNVISGKGNTNNYLQVNIQNRSAGTSASSDVVATNNAGTESVNYIDMGINSSGNTSTGVLGGANNAYLYGTGTDMAIGNSGTGVLKLFTGPGEDMRIDATGNVGIGTTAPIQKLDVSGNANVSGAIWVDNSSANAGTNTPAVMFGNTATGESIGSKRTTGGNQYGLDFYTNSTNRMAILQGGNVGIGTTTPVDKLTVAGAVSPSASNVYSLGNATSLWKYVYTANLLQISDGRLKTHVSDLKYGLTEIMELQPVSYNWRTTPNTEKQVGLIAQEVRKVIPEIVFGDESKENIAMSYTQLIPVLINAIKEQQKQIDSLKEQVLKLNK